MPILRSLSESADCCSPPTSTKQHHCTQPPRTKKTRQMGDRGFLELIERLRSRRPVGRRLHIQTRLKCETLCVNNGAPATPHGPCYAMVYDRFPESGPGGKCSQGRIRQGRWTGKNDYSLQSWCPEGKRYCVGGGRLLTHWLHWSVAPICTPSLHACTPAKQWATPTTNAYSR